MRLCMSSGRSSPLPADRLRAVDPPDDCPSLPPLDGRLGALFLDLPAEAFTFGTRLPGAARVSLCGAEGVACPSLLNDHGSPQFVVSPASELAQVLARALGCGQGHRAAISRGEDVAYADLTDMRAGKVPQPTNQQGTRRVVAGFFSRADGGGL